MTQVLTFKIEYLDGGPVSLMPCIDGVTLADLVEAFERANGYMDPAGGYGGIVPAYFNLGPLTSYFMGREGPIEGDEAGEIYALFCECGEAGCWPLIAHVRSDDQIVTWNAFAQPHRPKRDYSGFGPFEFARSEYDEALAIAASFDVE
ncbi:hypothetical protein HH800_11210 [Sphingobium yanoikuyae]|uniref:Uncharacterized protein n=1 Tax=Sphingobium yanoikuyae TaxID=13690 RepID=A0A6M4G5U3_SPHYA|nr:hypothetical protein [Sphingobium yanoikuyae]QJR02702.1 hypothetical protein HH800_11210 [Sphingobium yanoikuyae]